MNKSPEPIILAVALALLAFGVGYIAYTFPSLQDITNVGTTLPTGKTPPKLQEDELQASIDPWNSPAQWKMPENQHRLFISREYLFYPDLYPDKDYIVPVGPEARSPGGVLLSWYKKYQIDFTEPSVDRADPDGDGFSNIEEFKNGAAKASDCDGSKSTSPLDPLSHPSYLGQLRLQKFDPKPFRIQFRGIEQLNGKTNFEIYLEGVPSSQQPGFKATGDKLGVGGYVVGAYHQLIKSELNKNTGLTADVDESTLQLDQPETGNSVILPFQKIINSPDSTADLVMLMPTEMDKVIKVAPLQLFTLPYIPDKKYLLIKVDDTGATIRDTATKEDVSVPKLDPSEWDEVPLPPAATPQPKTP